MYAAALLLATAAVGVDTGWQPAQDDPQSVQYIIQIEPEVLQKMLRDGTPIDSIVPPDVHGGVIRCFRVQLGEDELPRELPEVAKATYEAPVEESATLRKIEAEPLELNPAPDNRSTASTATPPLNTLAADIAPRSNNTFAPGGSNYSGVGTPLNPTRTANAADANPSLSGSSSNFSIPGGSTTTPVGSMTPTSRFNPTATTPNTATSSTYPGTSYSGTPTTNPSTEYPNYTSPPLSNLNNNTTVPLGGNTPSASDSNYGRFGDAYATPSTGSNLPSGGTSYNSGNNYSSNLGSGSTANSGSSYNQGGLTPINSTPPSQTNNAQNNNGSGNYVPPSNNQQQPNSNNPNNNNYQQPNPNYQQPQQPFPSQPQVPYGQPNYVNAYQPPMANPYLPNMGYPAQYNPYLAALPGFGAPPLTAPVQQVAQTPAPAAQTPASSPSDRPPRDLDEEKTKPAEPVERPYWMLVIVAFLSLGFNIYMGWMVVDFRTKYRDILAGFRELKAAN